MFKSLCAGACLFISVAANALPAKDSSSMTEAEAIRYVDSVRRVEKYETGTVHLSGGKADIKVPPGFKFLNKEQGISVLTKIWGNPPETADKTLGMIFPENDDPFSDSSYAFVVEYEDIGYVKDDDAEKINYDEMLKNIQSEEKETNEARVKEGYPSIHLLNWAQPPFYDKQNKVLHWAKELQFGDETQTRGEHTLNYEIRILGRHGVLSVNAICKMSELPLVKANVDKVLHMATFTDGNSYFDFDPKVDKVAAWTIGGLVAGKILAKVGFFALIVKFGAAFWKFILLGFAAVGGFFKKLFNRNREKNTPSYETPPAEAVSTEVPEAATRLEGRSTPIPPTDDHP